MRLELQPDEIQVCQMIGRMRSLIARGNGVRDAKMGKQDGSEADVMGMMAEYGFAKKMNVFPDLGLTPRSGSSDGVMPSGKRYDVKASRHPNARLLSTLKVNPDVDVYVLCVVNDAVLDFKGWAWKEELIREDNKMNLGHGVGYALGQENLRKF
tara:strand:- start:3187 stop:3648 length:462 start_codon:yes stop_codon:yes gene_type:complete